MQLQQLLTFLTTLKLVNFIQKFPEKALNPLKGMEEQLDRLLQLFTTNLFENMRKRQMRKLLSIAFALTIPAITGTALSFATFEAKPAHAQAQLTQLRTYTLQTTTNSEGFFSVPHGLNSSNIQGIVVAVQISNGNWHNIVRSNSVYNEFWWNSEYVQGRISPFGENRPVKIILYVR